MRKMEVRRMRPKPKMSLLDKKIKPNPKYQSVEPVVQTGSNLRTELEKLDEIHQFYKFRNDEMFRRITVNNLVNLMVEVGKLEYQLIQSNGTLLPEQFQCDDERVENELAVDYAEDEEDEDIAELIKSQFVPRPAPVVSKPASRAGTARSLTSVVMGIGEMDLGRVSPVKEEDSFSRPFVILDVREPELFARSHISLAVNYPAIRLNRAFDYETKEMLRLKNKEDAIIVLYDDDESIANKCTTTLTQRGYDNVFLLSGGLRVAAIKYPESLITDRELDRMEEGDIIVIEKLLDENIMRGSSRLTGSRAGSQYSNRVGSRRSVSLDRAANGPQSRSDVQKMLAFDAPMRTSTALGRRQKR